MNKVRFEGWGLLVVPIRGALGIFLYIDPEED